jgi:hypothetical protein
LPDRYDRQAREPCKLALFNSLGPH